MAHAEPGISLLIVSDQIWKIITGEVIRSQEIEGLVAINTILGLALQGPMKKRSLVQNPSRVMVCVLRTDIHTQENINDDLQSFWNSDVMGTSPEKKKAHFCTLSRFIKNIAEDTKNEYSLRLAMSTVRQSSMPCLHVTGGIKSQPQQQAE